MCMLHGVDCDRGYCHCSRVLLIKTELFCFSFESVESIDLTRGISDFKSKCLLVVMPKNQ